jgi:manganese transport protein
MLMSEQATAAIAVPAPVEGWRRQRREATLGDVYRSIPIPMSVAPHTAGAAPQATAKTFRRFSAFLGPGYLVAVGYMDPGNWATAIAGGSKFGYALLWVALLSNLTAMVLQSLCARLAIASGRDLAQACHDAYPTWVARGLWVLAEVAIIATDLAEVLGTAIGIQLLFGLPLEIGIMITALDVFVILALQRMGFRHLEAFVITMLVVIALCFGVQIFLASPDWGAAARGLIPDSAVWRDREMLFLALGIVGATVMPHNLYLHSAIVQTRAYGNSPGEKREALRFATLDSTVALGLAFFVNASLLILAAASYNRGGHTNVTELSDAHALLAPLLGSNLAPTLFGIALLCCGLNSTVTATLAGQIVMEGFMNWRVAPWVRRLTTRALAVIPAAAIALIYGSAATAPLLIASQVVLALQLPFAVIPLIHLTASRAKMDGLVTPLWLTLISLVGALVIILMGLIYMVDSLKG